MVQKIIDFFIKKKVESITGTISQTSKTKIFASIEGLLLFIEYVTPYFNHPIIFPIQLHGFVCTLAGIAYAERQAKPIVTDAK